MVVVCRVRVCAHTKGRLSARDVQSVGRAASRKYPLVLSIACSASCGKEVPMKRLFACRYVLVLFGVIGCVLALASCDASDVLPQVTTNAVAGAHANGDPHGSSSVVGASTVT